MDIKSTRSTAAATQTRTAAPADDVARFKEAAAKLNRFLEDGPGGIFKPLNDFMKKNGDRAFGDVRREVLANIKD